MSDPQGDAPTTTPRGKAEEISDELTRSLSSIWRRHAGGKPSAVSTEIRENAVKFVLEDAVSGIGAVDPEVDGDANGDGAKADGVPDSPDSPAYRNEVIAAVRRITGRKVMGFIPKRDKKTDVASDTFILERVQIRR